MRIKRLLLVATLLATAGCRSAGTVLHVLFGAPAVDAQYQPQRRPTLVLVENYQDQDASAVDGDVVARQVGDALHAHAELPVIDVDQLAPLRTDHPSDFRDMNIPEVGKAVGAKQVVYVNLVENESSSDPTGVAVRATAIARVKVVDVDTGRVLWPTGQPKGHELRAKMDYDRTDSPQGAGMRAKLLGELSDEIAKLFYQYKPDSERESNEAGT